MRKNNPLQQMAEEPEQWIFSFADFMTLVACFFILLVSMANFDNKKVKTTTREIAKHFNPEEVKKIEARLALLKAELARHPQLKGGGGNERIEQFKSDIARFPDLHEAAQIKLKDAELNIVFSGVIIFNDGEYQLPDHYITLLDAMIDTLKTESSDYRIMIEGHSDDTPGKDPFNNDWTLSAARAATVAARFEYFGFRKKNIVAIGHGSSQKLYPSIDSYNSRIEANAKMNRRITIKFLEPVGDKKIKMGLGTYFENRDN